MNLDPLPILDNMNPIQAVGLVLGACFLFFAVMWLMNRDAKSWLEEHSGQEDPPQIQPTDWQFRMTRDEFYRVAWQVMNDMPEEFKKALSGVELVVQDWPDDVIASQHPGVLVLGVYVGSRPARWDLLQYGGKVIKLFQGNIERVTTDDESLREKIRTTVLHEVGHALGMGHEKLIPLGL